MFPDVSHVMPSGNANRAADPVPLVEPAPPNPANPASVVTGRRERVLVGSEVVDGPLPAALDGVIVNVYSVSDDRPGNVKLVPDVVCVVVGGDDTMEYWVAFAAENHIRLTVVVVGPPAAKPVTAGGKGGGTARVLIELEVVGGPLPDILDGVIVNVYAVSGVRPVNVKVVPDVVCVVVDGDDTMEYSVAYRAEFHTRSTVVYAGLEAVKPVTAGGGGRGRVLIELEVVGGPLPYALDGVIVNVYDVSDARPGNVKVVPDVVCVVVGGDDTMEYSVAYSAEFHTRSTVVYVGLEAVKPVTAGGGGGRVLIELEVVGGPLPDTLDGVIVNV